MKKKLFVIVLLAILLLLPTFTGCAEKESGPLRICVDLDFVGGYEGITAQGAMEGLLYHIAEIGGPTDVTLEIIPGSVDDLNARETALTRVRTEIMGGEGPDVFIMACPGGYYSNSNTNFYQNSLETLFAVPEKIMANGVFLPLDEYIENAQFMEWDKLVPQVMAAGRDEYGQQIIPLSYTMPITFYRAADIAEKPSAETTWNDMIADETGVLSTAATWFHIDSFWHKNYENPYMENTFGPLADYSTDKLLFTEEELMQRMTEIMDLEKQYSDGLLPKAPTHYQTQLAIDYNHDDSRTTYYYDDGHDPFRGIKAKEEQTMIPIYSDDGGITATVLYYAAVNANTKRPEDAFFIIDYLLSREMQQKSPLYEYWFTATITGGFPTHMDVLQPKYPYWPSSGEGKQVWYLTEENYAEFCRVRDQITHARFRGGLDLELSNLYRDCRGKYLYDVPSSETIEKTVAEYYRRMERIMGE